LTLLDDHSRFALQLKACSDQRLLSVKGYLQEVFERYGLPRAILCDNGTPWRGSEPGSRFTSWGVWLLQVGVEIWHGRPYHPQTQGKEERFHRTLQLELLDRTTAWLDHDHCCREFEAFRHRYNSERPHQALDLAVPASRYRPSPRSWPGRLPQPEYLSDDLVRLVRAKGEVRFSGKSYYVGQAFSGQYIAFRPTQRGGYFELYFCWKNIGSLDLNDPLLAAQDWVPLCAPKP
jgi:hypothetical protein